MAEQCGHCIVELIALCVRDLLWEWWYQERRQQQPQPPRMPRVVMLCQTCNLRGHLAYQCNQSARPAPYNKANVSKSKQRCYKCNLQGHEASACKAKADVIPEAQPQQEQEQKPEAEACVICLGQRKTHLFAPCGHKCVCQDCVISVDECPVCRAAITARVRVYDA
jgi:hypothetical protein